MKDIFISYRRENKEGQAYGTTIAYSVYNSLNEKGYYGRVFLDHEGIRNENFEERILGTIRQAKVFILILTQDTLDRCQNDGDWVRREICVAKESGLEIIVVNYNNEFKDYPKNFPAELYWLKKHNRQSVRAVEFSEDMTKLINGFISPAIERKELAVKEEQRAKKEAEKREQERIRREALEKKKQEERAKQIEKQQKITARKQKINASIQEVKSSKLAKIAMWLACVIAVIGIGWLSLSLYQNEQKKYLLYFSDSDFEIIEEGGKYGFKLKKNDEVVIPIKYSKVENFDSGLARVSNDEKWGLINKTGKLVVPMLYDEIGYLYSNYNGLRKVKLGNKYGMINVKGELVIPLEYEYLSVSGDLVDVKKNSKCGFINFQNEEVIPLKYDNTFYFSDGLCGVGLNNKYGYVDKQGNEVIPLIYDSADSFSEGLAAVKKDGKWGYIDTQWNVVIDFAPYDRVWSFGEDGLATVCLYGDYGAIDKTGKVVIPIIYDKQFSFRQGKAEVQLKGQKFVIDITGKKINETK